MTKNFYKITQTLLFVHLLCQTFWVTHLNFPRVVRLNQEQVDALLIIVPAIYISTGIFVATYLFKKKFRFAFVALVLNATFYSFLIICWYLLLASRMNFANYKLVYHIFLVISFSYGMTIIFSNSGERIWIKRVGIAVVVICLVNGTFEILPNYDQHSPVRFFRTAVDFLGGLVSIFWILNFQNEIRTAPLESDSLIDAP